MYNLTMHKITKPLKAEDLLKKFDGDPTQSISMMYPGTGTLQKVSCDPKVYAGKDLTKLEKALETVTLYDGSIEVMKIDKTAVHKHIESLKQPMKDKGIDFLIYRSEYLHTLFHCSRNLYGENAGAEYPSYYHNGYSGTGYEGIHCCI